MNCHLSEITEFKYTSLIKMVILEENFKWHLEAFASELFIYFQNRIKIAIQYDNTNMAFLTELLKHACLNETLISDMKIPG